MQTIAVTAASCLRAVGGRVFMLIYAYNTVQMTSLVAILSQ